MLKTILTDEELINAFQHRNGAKNTYLATFIPEDAEKSTVHNWHEVTFTANSKEEAVRIAREYGSRIILKRMIYVYRHRG